MRVGIAISQTFARRNTIQMKQYACRIIFTLFALALSIALLRTPNPSGFAINLKPLLGLIGLVLGTPIAFFIGKRIDQSWWNF